MTDSSACSAADSAEDSVSSFFDGRPAREDHLSADDPDVYEERRLDDQF
ncbi:MAG: hypothetical protein K0U78_08885 [Actinomycetia bacterium]|nr:hypothetical protein [Actinomycetes bacterium]